MPNSIEFPGGFWGDKWYFPLWIQANISMFDDLRHSPQLSSCGNKFPVIMSRDDGSSSKDQTIICWDDWEKMKKQFLALQLNCNGRSKFKKLSILPEFTRPYLRSSCWCHGFSGVGVPIMDDVRSLPMTTPANLPPQDWMDEGQNDALAFWIGEIFNWLKWICDFRLHEIFEFAETDGIPGFTRTCGKELHLSQVTSLNILFQETFCAFCGECCSKCVLLPGGIISKLQYP